MRAARVAGGTRPMVDGPRMKFHSSGGGPTTSTVVADELVLGQQVLELRGHGGRKTAADVSIQRKEAVGKADLMHAAERSSGALKGLMSRPSAIGFSGAGATAARAVLG